MSEKKNQSKNESKEPVICKLCGKVIDALIYPVEICPECGYNIYDITYKLIDIICKKIDDKYNISEFKKFTLNLPDLGYKMNQEGTDYRGDRELSSNAMQKIVNERKTKIELLNTEIEDIQENINEINSKEEAINKNELKKNYNRLNLKKDKITTLRSDVRKYQVEIHKKYAIAFACVIFVLIGAPIGMMTKTSGVGMSFSVSAIVFLIYYGSLTLGEELADKGVVSPFLAMWVSNIIFSIIGIYLVVISVKEMKTLDLTKIRDKVNKFLGFGIR